MRDSHAYQPVRQRAGRFRCAHPDCELRYNDRGAALECCSERFDDSKWQAAIRNSTVLDLLSIDHEATQ